MPETNIAVIEKPALLLEIETPQTIALQKENIVELELQRIEKAYKGFRVNGLDDVQGIIFLSDARKYCKKVRTSTVRICKDGRAPAIDEQDRWLKIEKYVVDRVLNVENELIAEEQRIEELKEVARKEEAQRVKEREEELDSLCLEFARLGKVVRKDDIRFQEAGIVQELLDAARKAKAEKEATEKKEAERREAEMKRLRDEKCAADERAEAMQRRIAELEAQLNPPAQMPAPEPMPEKEQEPQGFAASQAERVEQGNEIAADKPSLPALPKLPLPPTNGAAKNAVPATPEPFRMDETTKIRQDKTALITFAQQVALLKKYLPVVHSEKAAGLNELIADQIEKFAAFVTKKAEAL